MHDSDAHFLLAGDSTDLRAMRDAVNRLPVNAYGQVFIEVASAVQIQRWDAPSGITVTWLCRDESSGPTSRVAPRGELVARALSAWLSEWTPENHTDRDRPHVLWIGCCASEHVDRLYRELASRIPHRHHPNDD